MSTKTPDAAAKKMQDRRMRLDITLPISLILAIDAAALAAGVNRSRWLEEASLVKLKK